jgi:ACS family glucarate transporter-like MFS transporter
VEERSGFELVTKQVLLVALLFALSAMSYFDRTIMSIAGPEIIREFRIEPTQMGWVYSSFVLGYAVFMIPGGGVADWLGPGKTLALMTLAAALFTALTPLGAHSTQVFLGAIPLLIGIRCAFGLASAPLYPACARMCFMWIPMAQQARVQAFIIAGASLGGALSPILFTWLMSLYTWRGSFYIASSATAVLALLWASYVRKLPHNVEPMLRQPKQLSWRRLLTNRNLSLLTFAYLTVGYFEYIFFYWIYYYFGEVRHTGFAQSARYTSVIFLVMLVMMPVGGWTSDWLTHRYGSRLGRRLVPVVGLTIGALLLVLGVTSPDTGTAAVCLALAVGFASFCEGPFWTMAMGIGGPQAGAAGGIMNAGGNVGGFLSPLFTPVFAKCFGWSWGLFAGSAIVVLGALACWLIDVSEEPSQDVLTPPNTATIPVA